MNSSAIKDSLVVFQNSQGVELRATLVRVTRFNAVFEIYSSASLLRTSEVLAEFRIDINEHTVYSGRAIVSNIIHTGTASMCEVKLDETSSNMIGFITPNGNGSARAGTAEYQIFLSEWQKLYKVRPEFKVVVADMQTFLTDLRLWLNQIEMTLRASPPEDRLKLEQDIAEELSPGIVRSIDSFIEQFEVIAASLEPELEPVHRNFLRRQLHPLVMCSPFAYRTFHKPLGYAGDYEVVDMMLRPPHEGSTLFAKMINVWLLNQAPAQGHRNRVAYLEQKLVEATLRAKAQGRRARVFNLGCGPAGEVKRFLRDRSISDDVHFTLLDFNEETLQNLRIALENLKSRCNRKTSFEFVKKSVNQILKEAFRSTERPSIDFYDLVYCAGLFDYLSDQVCKKLMNFFYELVTPGGLLLATNVTDILNDRRPFRYSMEYFLDWHLIYRSGPEFGVLKPDSAKEEDSSIVSDDTSANVFIEVRKPDNA